MSAYTDARSKPGQKGASGTDDRQLYLIEFGEKTLFAYDEVMDYDDLHFTRQIASGKADSFPIIGRKRDAADHIPGTEILGGGIEHNEVQITVDNMVVDSAFIAEIDEHLNHFDLGSPYAKQIGQSLGSLDAKRIAITHILASRNTVAPYVGGPVPAYFFHANARTDASKLELAAFLARQYLLENDISGDLPKFMLPHAQALLLARYSGIEGGPVTTGSGNRAQGTVGPLAGLTVQGSNHIPKTNITTGLTKYQGNFADTVGHISSRMAVGTLQVRGLKVVMKEQAERLGTILIGSQLNGHGTLRNECAIEVRISDLADGRTALA